MAILFWILVFSEAIPLWALWRANRTTSLSHAVVWGALAWLSWVFVFLACELGGAGAARTACYVALSLTAVVGIAILGARRPGVTAWNFVIAALLAVLLLPLAQGLGEVRVSVPQGLFLTFILVIGALNYLPTRHVLGVFAFLGAAMIAWGQTADVAAGGQLDLNKRWMLALTHAMLLGFPLLPHPGSRRRNKIYALWTEFRDRFGFVWAERTRQQFNVVAENAGLMARLTWRGLQNASAKETTECEAILRSLLKRFGMENATV